MHTANSFTNLRKLRKFRVQISFGQILLSFGWNLWSFPLLSLKLKIKVYIKLPFYLFYETCCLIQSEEYGRMKQLKTKQVIQRHGCVFLGDRISGSKTVEHRV